MEKSIAIAASFDECEACSDPADCPSNTISCMMMMMMTIVYDDDDDDDDDDRGDGDFDVDDNKVEIRKEIKMWCGWSALASASFTFLVSN